MHVYLSVTCWYTRSPSPLHRGENRPREGKVAQGHTGGMCWGWEANPGTLALNSISLLYTAMRPTPRSRHLSYSEFGPGWDLLSSLGPVQPQDLCSCHSLCLEHSLPLSAPLPNSCSGSQLQCHCFQEPQSLLRLAEASLKRWSNSTSSSPSGPS